MTTEPIPHSDNRDIRTLVQPKKGRRAANAVRAIDWNDLEAEEYIETLDELIDWTARLAQRYNLDHRHIPDCWTEHGELIEELSALHTAWRRSFAPDALGESPLRWHEQFDAARRRLSDWVARTGCRPKAHRPSTSAP